MTDSLLTFEEMEKVILLIIFRLNIQTDIYHLSREYISYNIISCLGVL